MLFTDRQTYHSINTESPDSIWPPQCIGCLGTHFRNLVFPPGRHIPNNHEVFLMQHIQNLM